MLLNPQSCSCDPDPLLHYGYIVCTIHQQGNEAKKAACSASSIRYGWKHPNVWLVYAAVWWNDTTAASLSRRAGVSHQRKPSI